MYECKNCIYYEMNVKNCFGEPGAGTCHRYPARISIYGERRKCGEFKKDRRK